MTVGIVQSGDAFTMGGVQYDMETLLVTLQMQRAENIDRQLTDQADQIRRRNEQLGLANAALASARKQRPTKDDAPASTEDPAYTHYVNNYLGTEGRDNTGNDYLHNQAEWDKNIEILKAHIDTLNSSSQMDMIRLQSLMNKRNQAFEMMTNSISKLNKPKDSVIGNLR